MKTAKKIIYVIVISLFLNQAYAQYAIKKHTINNGGGKLTGGSYELNGSVGQIDASNSMSGGTYTINGGFWQENNDLIFKNGFE